MADQNQRALVDRFQPRLKQELVDLDRLYHDNALWSAPVELDQQAVGRVSRIDAMQMQAVSLAVQRRRATRRVAIEQALKRIATGDFGYCLECGEPITPGRLDIDPTFTACVDCAL